MTSNPTRSVPAIGDYGVIGDGRSAALVSRDGSIDWCCLPDFDSAACFGRILDQELGGCWCLAPEEVVQRHRRYLPDTTILAQEFVTPSGRVRVQDFMPIGPSARTGGARIIRQVEGLEGWVQLRLDCAPRFNFGSRMPELEARSGTQVLVRDGETTWSLDASFPLQVDDRSVRARFAISAHERHWVVFGSPSAEPTTARVAQHFAETVEHWRAWVASLRYEGQYAEQVIRSALTLKLLTYASTGAIIAAPTTSLPEVIGGDANWDYRFAWLRDAALTVAVFQRLGRHEESDRFLDWIQSLPCPEALQPVYTIHGAPELPEQELTQLSGYRDSRPVRIGNAAAPQHQLDAGGHILEAAFLCYDRLPRPMDPRLWEVLRTVADAVCERWREPDTSIWETRRGRRQFLHSKLYAWVALDRALGLARRQQLPGRLADWQRERDAIRSLILEHGYSERLGSFTAVIGEDELDASTLMIPLVGFLPADDPRMRATVERVRAELGTHGLLRRNAALATGEHEGAFLACSFWLADNLVLAGQWEDAQGVFERVLAQANDLGLLAEQASTTTGELLGNFPQSFSHLGLIHTACLLTESRSTARSSPHPAGG